MGVQRCYTNAHMKAVRIIINVVAAVTLAMTFIGAGFAVCTMPPVTHGLSWVFSDDATSPFDRNQLAKVADATREYSFGDHDLLKLYQVIYEVDIEYRDNVGYSAASTTGAGFPRVDQVSDTTSVQQLRSAFDGASELYCYSQDTIKHLDDCYNLARFANPLIIASIILALASLVFTGVTGGRKRLGAALLGAGAVVIVAFVGLGVWAAIDFQGFFAAFHQLFFSQGNWQFPYDSLLICALPTAFWASMGAVWLLVSLVLSVLAIVIGRKLVRK